MVDKRVQVDVNAQVGPGFAKLQQLLDSINAGAKAVHLTLRDVTRSTAGVSSTVRTLTNNQSNADAVAIRQLLREFKTTRQLSSAISAGDPRTQLTNAFVSGELNKLKAQGFQPLARTINGTVGELNQLSKAVKNNRILQLKEASTTGFRTALKSGPASFDDAKLFVEAAKLRVATAEAGVLFKENPSKKAVADLETQKKLLEESRQTLATMVPIRQQDLSIGKRLSQLQQQENLLESQIQVYRQNGLRLEADQLNIKKQQITLDRIRLQSEGKITQEVVAQQNVLAQAQRKFDKTKTDTRADRVLGDGGLSLLKIQASLFANYAVINSIFQLFQFGKQFTVELDKALFDLQAVTATTSTEMKGLGESILDVSKGTKFTAVEVAQAAVILGQAGFSAKQIADSLEGITKFATAVGTDLTTATDLATSVLSVFELTAEDTTRVMNVLVSSINGSKLTVDKLSLALQYAGNTAKNSGTSFEELTAVIGAFANAGVRNGSIIGTGLNQLIVSLINPSEKLVTELRSVGLTLADVDVQSQGLIPVLKKLDAAGFGSAQAFESMEVRAARAYLAIKGQIGTIDELQQSFLLSNATIEASETQLGSLANKMSVFASNLGVVISKLTGPFVGAFKVALDVSSLLLGTLGDMGTALNLVGTAVTSVGIAFAGLKLYALTQGMGVLAVATTSVGIGLGLTVPLWGLIAAGILAVTVVLAKLSGNTERFKQAIDQQKAKVNEARQNFDSYGDSITSIQNKKDELIARYPRLSSNQQELGTQVLDTKSKFGALGLELDAQESSIDKVISSLDGLIDKYHELQKISLESLIEETKSLIKAYGEAAANPNLSTGGLSEFLPIKLRTTQTERDTNRIQTEIGNRVKEILAADGLGGRQRLSSEDKVAVLSGADDELERLLRQIKAATDISEKERDRLTAQVNSQRGNLRNQRGQILTLDAQQIQLDTKNLRKLPEVAQAEKLVDKLGTFAAQLTENLSSQKADGTRVVLSNESTKAIIDAARTDLVPLREEFNSLLNGPQGAALERTGVADRLREAFNEVINEQNHRQDELNVELKKAADANSEAATASLKQAENASRFASSFEQLTKTQAARRSALGAQQGATIAAFDADAENAKLSRTDPEAFARKRGALLLDLNLEAQQLDEQFRNEINNFLALNGELRTALGGFVKGVTDASRALSEADSNTQFQRDLIDARIAGAQQPGSNVVSIQIKQFERQKQELEKQALKDRVPLLQDLIKNTEALNAKQDEAAKEQIDRLKEQAKKENLTFEERKENADKLIELEQGIYDRRKELLDLTRELKVAEATTETAEAPEPTFGEVIKDTIENKRKDIEDKGSIFKQLKDEIPNVLDEAEAGFKGFFKDIITGTESVSEAFKKMGQKILLSLADLFAELAAQQLFKLILQFAGSALGGAGGGSTLGPLSVTGTKLAMGGPIRAASGRGVVGRDSVLALVEPGEYVLRKSAVDLIGQETLDQINAAGNRSIAQSSSNIPHGGARSEPFVSNVYVVAPNEQPPGLTKNDVIAIIGKDVLENGQTKQLIRRVASGQ